MSYGFLGVILNVNLSSGKIEKLQMNDEFYRMYMGGGAVGSYFLLKETDPDTEPLSDKIVMIIAPGVTTKSLQCIRNILFKSLNSKLVSKVQRQCLTIGTRIVFRKHYSYHSFRSQCFNGQCQ